MLGWLARPAVLFKTVPLLTFFLCLLIFREHIPKSLGFHLRTSIHGHDVLRNNLTLANATLGFSSIVAISTENQTAPHSWRQKGLSDAANLTGLHINIHQSEQENVPLSWYAGLPLTKDGRRLGMGYALSAKSHLDTLQEIIDSGQETVLILEDDADWDVRIREQLSPEGGISLLLRSFDNTPEDKAFETPYGLDWDVLFLGHCGHETGARTKHQESFKDMTVPDLNWVRSHWNYKHYASFSPHQRTILDGGTALCTFGYAVTQKGARRLMELNRWEDPWDGMILYECKKGNMHCNIVAPELIHHQRSSQVSPLDSFNGGHDIGPAEHFFTMNIEYSARCNAHRGEDDGASSEVQWITCPPTREQFVNDNS